MDHRYFNTIMPFVNHTWLADVMNMHVNRGKGPDLISPLNELEVKFTLKSDDRRYPVSWTVMEHQMKYKNGKPINWALGIYWLKKPVADIPSNSSLNRLENLIEIREVYIVPWDFMLQYPPHETNGISKTTGDSWKNTFRYPKIRDIPEPVKPYAVKKGLIHILPEVNTSILRINISRGVAPQNAIAT